VEGMIEEEFVSAYRMTLVKRRMLLPERRSM
jgi:hypothetical protein